MTQLTVDTHTYFWLHFIVKVFYSLHLIWYFLKRKLFITDIFNHSDWLTLVLEAASPRQACFTHAVPQPDAMCFPYCCFPVNLKECERKSRGNGKGRVLNLGHPQSPVPCAPELGGAVRLIPASPTLSWYECFLCDQATHLAVGDAGTQQLCRYGCCSWVRSEPWSAFWEGEPYPCAHVHWLDFLHVAGFIRFFFFL